MQTWVEAEEVITLSCVLLCGHACSTPHDKDAVTAQAIPSNDYVAQSAFKAELRQAFQVVPDLKAFFEDPELAACLSDPQVPCCSLDNLQNAARSHGDTVSFIVQDAEEALMHCRLSVRLRRC